MTSTLNATNYRARMNEVGRRDDALYERFGKTLESKHTGEFVAISEDGRLIVGPDEISVTSQALEQFGRGQFAFRRIGWDYEGRIRSWQT